MDRKLALGEIKKILQRHGISKAYLFGSFARGEKNYNDIDVAVKPPENFSLLDMAGVMVELEDALGKKVDIISLDFIKPRLKARIKKDFTVVV